MCAGTIMAQILFSGQPMTVQMLGACHEKEPMTDSARMVRIQRLTISESQDRTKIQTGKDNEMITNDILPSQIIAYSNYHQKGYLDTDGADAENYSQTLKVAITTLSKRGDRTAGS